MASAADRELIIGMSPASLPDGALAGAVGRGGGYAVLDVGDDATRATTEIRHAASRVPGTFAIRVSDAAMAGQLEQLELPTAVDTVVVAVMPEHAASAITTVRAGGRRAWAEVTSVPEARAALDAGADGLISKGSESGGRVGPETAFVLAQRVIPLSAVPVWVKGGISLHTAAAAMAGGAAGVVIDAQLALARECGLSEDVRFAIGAMDGSETVLVGGHRVYHRPDLPPLPDAGTPAAEVAGRLGADDLRTQLLPVGQDGAFAASLARRFVTAGGIVQGLRRSIDDSLAAARREPPFAPDRGVASRWGTRYPIAQGPMTRVSDQAAFAASVADGGGLPFLALSLLPGHEVATLLAETADLLGDRPWGVGILGFVPPELRDEQLAVVREVRPPIALIAGGRPSQAAPLEAEGIVTYLHVPSPGLLDRFLKDGSRRFVFEGSECGGHVGPRSSFALWQAQTERLLAERDLADVHVLFAGGIHDARSAAMAGALAAPLAERGAAVGVLMGTAYAFTAEAVATRAITPTFQQEVLAAGETVLLETAPGHATRCVDSEYVERFREEQRRLQAAGVAPGDMWEELEQLNLGRLRIAAKGLVREGDRLVEVDAARQATDGMFMIGQVAALRSELTSIAELHCDVSEGSSALLEATRPTTDPVVQTGKPLQIAVIGMAGFFPGAEDLDRYWANILGNVDNITEVPRERWDADRYYDPVAAADGAPDKVPSKWGGFLPDIAFDPTSYGIPPRSIAAIGSDQLLSLEVASAALADAGYAVREFDRERAAVVFGAESGSDLANAYSFRSMLPQYLGQIPEELAATLPELTEDSFPGVLANVIAGRIANRLNLGGANYTVDAACGASLAALSAACKELSTDAADMVLCGGADLHNGIYDYLLFAGVHALSPTGRCRSFDDDADGIALGEGVGCIVLKRLADAERDGDRILAVIEAVAASSDGRSLGLTAPRKEGQRLALDRAYAQAGVSPATVGLIEAHGTGTVVGDRTELATLTEVFEDAGATEASCALGSVKSQIGHTKCAAGIAGLIKAVHAVHRGVLPPTLNISSPNDAFDEKTSPFAFYRSPRPWLATERRAGISAFGFGGANFHAVITSYADEDDAVAGVDHWPAELFVIRGESDRAAAHLAELANLVEANDRGGRPWRLRDLARTVHHLGRGPVRWAFVADDLDDLAVKITAHADGTDPAGGFASTDATPQGSVAFLFPGQGSQRVNMLADLFVAFPLMRRFLRMGRADWVDVMFPPAAFGDRRKEQTRAMTDTRIAQPALGMADLSMAALLGACGVEPDAVAGHSYGELAALASAGVIRAEDAIELSAARADAILSAAGDDPGTMAAVRGSAESVRPLLADHPAVIVANDNAPDQCVISGPTAEIEAAIGRLSGEGLAAKQIAVACAFHTPGLAQATDDLATALDQIEVRAPSGATPWSNLTARSYPTDPAGIRSLLAGQVSAPVAFRQQIEAMYDAGHRVFVEAGPGRVLTQLVDRILADRPHVAVATDVSGDHGIRRFLLALAELAAAGVDVDAGALYDGRDAKVIDVGAAPSPAPFLLNGHLVRTRQGDVVDGALLPADRFEPLAVGASTGAPVAAIGAAAAAGAAPAIDRDAVVNTFLTGMQDLVSSQRDVMLAFLGAAPPAAALSAAPVASPATATSAPAVVIAAAPPPEATPAPVASALSPEALLALVIRVVSDRTGYPAEMLDPDLDLEAELSIDSIKRIEIIGDLSDEVGLPSMDETGVDDSVVEELALIKTLRGIVEWIDGHRAEQPAAQAPAASVSPTTSHEEHVALTETQDVGLTRSVPKSVPLAFAQEDRSLRGRRIVIALDRESTASPFITELREVLLDTGAVVDVTAPSDDVTLDAAIVIDVGLLTSSGRPAVTSLFERLQRTCGAGASEYLVVTADADGHEVESAAAARALVRTAAREHTGVLSRVVEVDRQSGAERMARWVVTELRRSLAPTVVTCTPAGRSQVVIVPAPIDDAGRRPMKPLGPQSVVAVTGGARGIGALAAIALAERFGCRIAVLGRSPAPDDEPAQFAGAADLMAVRKVLIDQGELTRPAEIEATAVRVLADREIRATLIALERSAAESMYLPVDVNDDDGLRDALAAIWSRWGAIDGIVHAAGVREDKLIRDKSVDSFRRVYDTKVGPTARLLDAVDDDGFVVFFASVSGVFGNTGQCDYAAANHVLDAVARHAVGRRGGHVAAIDWGPWAGAGMVTPELVREYERRGVRLIEPSDGVDALIAEIEHGLPDPQVVLTAGSIDALVGGAAPAGTATTIDLSGSRQPGDHRSTTDLTPSSAG